MPINSIGAVSMGGPTTGESVNTELNNSTTDTITLNDTAVRQLGNKLGNANEISMNDLRGKYSRYALIDWPSNLQGGSTQVNNVEVANWNGGVILNGQSMDSIGRAVMPLSLPRGGGPGFDAPPNNGSYLEWYINCFEFLNWNTDGSPNLGPVVYKYWSSRQYGPYIFIGGIGNIRSYTQPASINNVIIITHRNGATDPLSSSGLPGLTINLIGTYPGSLVNNGGTVNFGEWSIPFTVRLKNDTGKTIYIQSSPGYNSRGPFYLGWVGGSGGWGGGGAYKYDLPGYCDEFAGQRMTWNNFVAGGPLSTKLTINGFDLTYTAPDGATKTDILNGFNNVINNAGISGVSSSINSSNQLRIRGITSSVVVSFVQIIGSTNYTPTIANYGL